MTTKLKIKAAAVTVLALAVLLEIGYILCRDVFTDRGSDSGVVGTASASSQTVMINNGEIPAYNITGKNELYFSGDDLSSFGFTVKDEGTCYSLIAAETVTDGTPELSYELAGSAVYEAGKKLLVNEAEFDIYTAENTALISDAALASIGSAVRSGDANTVYFAFGTNDEINNILDSAEVPPAASPTAAAEQTGAVIVLDPGHGKSSSAMSDEEKLAQGWVQNSDGEWGEWRHYKSGSSTADCEGSGCTGRVTPNGACWYPIGNGDRADEPDINLTNAIAAKRYLEDMGYTVRLTRESSDENPSITRRLSFCYPDNDTSKNADAAVFVCIHSNAGGGSGSAYISLEGEYDQRGITDTYVQDSNRLGKYINDCIISETSLTRSGSGSIDFEPELIAFCKSPVPCGYLEIGFFDNGSDLEILELESDLIGSAIANGIDSFLSE